MPPTRGRGMKQPKPRGKDNKNRNLKIKKKNVAGEIDSPAMSGDEDAMSEISTLSIGSEGPHSDGVADAVDETLSVEEMQDKVKEAIDGLTEKTAQHRLACLKVIIHAFSTQDMEDLMENLIETLIDGTEKCLKRGKPEEQALAARLLAMIVIHCGPGKHGEELFQRFLQTLVPVIQDESVNVKARAKSCEALAVCSFIACDDMNEIVKCMDVLTTVFKKSYYKGDGTVPNITPAVANLHSSALSAWSLLMSICPWSIIADFIKSHFPKIPELLESKELAVRMVGGETLALFYEILHSEGQLHVAKKHIKRAEICEKLKELSTDSSKYRAKKDRREQRSTFRDVLRTVEDGEMPDDQIKFGRETLYLDSWTRKRQYEILKDVLSTGMNFHLATNELLRDIFALGPAIIGQQSAKKSSDRHMYHQAAFKARTKHRGKLRDKRVGAI